VGRTDPGGDPFGLRHHLAGQGIIRHRRSRPAERAGELEQAAATLERALRLEPRNAMLWHRLARLRLKQGQWRNAVDLAAKSNSLAGEDGNLQGWNWAVIAEAKERLGDAEGAAAARAHLGDDAGR
jgi:predicted Zn-dependent protease